MYLGIDIGTSAVKAVLVDSQGSVVAQASVSLTLQSPKPSWSEQDPDAWWDAVLNCGAQLAANPAYTDVRAIGLSGQMHGAVCLDDAHRPLRPAILWNDGRAYAECAAMLAEMPDIGMSAGVQPMPGFTAPKLRWLAQAEPDVHARVRHVMLPKDYIRLKLSGVCATDMSDAAGTMWLDQSTRQWSDALCAVSATDSAWLPDLVEGTEIAGTLTPDAAAALGLRVGVPIAGGGGDGAAGAMGIGAVQNGDAFVSLGTSSQLFVTTDTYRPKPETFIHAYAHCVPNRWFQMAAMLNGASALGWWASAVQTSIDILLAEANDAPTSTEVPLFLPYLAGERTPHNDPHIRGAFYGLIGATDRAAMTKSVLDAIAYTFCDAHDALAAAGTQVKAAAVIGGGAQGDLLLQTLADAMGISLRRYTDAETGPAFGAARLAMVASGQVTIEEIASTPETDKMFEPNVAEADRHRSRLADFRQLYRTLAPYSVWK